MATFAREAATAVCRHCGERFPLSRHSNRYHVLVDPS